MQMNSRNCWGQPIDSIPSLFHFCDVLDRLHEFDAPRELAMQCVEKGLMEQPNFDCRYLLRISAAKAIWRIDRHRELALPILVWGLRDEYWGFPAIVLKFLAEMGSDASAAVPDIVAFVHHRVDQGPPLFETMRSTNDEESVLVLAVRALAECAPCTTRFETVREALEKIQACDDLNAASAAAIAMEQLA